MITLKEFLKTLKGDWVKILVNDFTVSGYVSEQNPMPLQFDELLSKEVKEYSISVEESLNEGYYIEVDLC